MPKRRSKARRLDGTPSAVARAAFMRSGAGRHGGSDRAQNKRDRSVTKRTLRGLDKGAGL